MRLSQFYQVKIIGFNAREAPERTASLFELLYPSKGANGISTDKSASVTNVVASLHDKPASRTIAPKTFSGLSTEVVNDKGRYHS